MSSKAACGAGKTLRITAQLVDARSGEHVWAQRFDRPVRDAFSVQDEVTQKIVAAPKMGHPRSTQAGAPLRSIPTMQTRGYFCL